MSTPTLKGLLNTSESYLCRRKFSVKAFLYCLLSLELFRAGNFRHFERKCQYFPQSLHHRIISQKNRTEVKVSNPELKHIFSFEKSLQMDKTVNFTCLLYSLQCKEKRYVPCSLFEFALNGKKVLSFERIGS